jgi:SdpC family antimicrobial peptide
MGHRPKSAGLAALVLAAVCSACSSSVVSNGGGVSSTASTSGSSTGPPKKFTSSADDLVRGLYFAMGPVADELPTTKKIQKYQPPELAPYVDATVATLDATDPAFMKELVTTVESGDRVRIGRLLDSGRTNLAKALVVSTSAAKDEFGRQMNDAAQRSLANDPSVDVAKRKPQPDADQNIVVLIVVAFIIFVVVALVLPTAPVPTELKGLSRDVFVNEIAMLVKK